MIPFFAASLSLNWRAQTLHAKISSFSLAIKLRDCFTQSHLLEGTTASAFIQLVARSHASELTRYVTMNRLSIFVLFLCTETYCPREELFTSKHGFLRVPDSTFNLSDRVIDSKNL